MDKEEIIYRGNAHVYLQGKGALQPLDINNPEYYTYFIGTEASSIQVKDYRQETNRAATAQIENRLEGEFADVFNQPAQVKISEVNGNVEIEIQPGREDSSSPILWMGMIYDGKMPVHRIMWEVLQPIEDNAVAFVVLVED